MLFVDSNYYGAIVLLGYLLPTVVYRCLSVVLALVALGSGHLSHLSLNQFRRKKFDSSTMMNGRLFLGRLRPRRLTWTLLVGIIMMFALSSSANEVRFY